MLNELKDFKISKQDMPELLYAERRQLQIERYQAYLETLTGEDKAEYDRLQAAQAAEEEKQQQAKAKRAARWCKKQEQRHVREMAEYKADLERFRRDEAAKAAWAGTKRVARWIQARLEKSGVEFKRVDAMTGSVYFYTRDDKLRVSDHEQPEGGAWNHELGYRAGEPTVNVTPWSANWRKAVAEVVENNMAL